MQRIIKSVADPIPEDATYDVYISYRYNQGGYATQIADDLNESGISAFVMTKHMNIGDDYHEVGWNAMLQAKFHIVILTPDIATSDYIQNEIRVSQTKNTRFIPILSKDHLNDVDEHRKMQDTFKYDDEFRELVATQ